MPADPGRVKALFVAALDLPDEPARRAFLDRECAADPDLRRRLDLLLRAHDHPESALERPLAGPLTPDRSPAGVPGAVVAGRYKLLELIGEGGMGAVWVADQSDPIRRRVALKLIKPGMDSRGVLARFEAERQALALMDHPNIAKVLDAGTTEDGRPYFVMELVKGVPITQFCDARKLSPRERLELFVPVCQAIQHAHTKGIIHRDVKPSNVLVALHDEKPVVKVIDFGVAKAVGHQLTEKTLYTGFGTLVGTPAYMAPEQATFNQLDVDTRADVYALGVLLYELLAGSPPFEPERLREAALDEVLRIVREEEPPRPSQRLSTSQARATVAAARQSDPARLASLMRGELDWIVMKALEKDRARRYETATGLAQDVTRYLRDEPVEACPPTLGYRARKFVRKNRRPVAAAGLLLLALLGGLAGTAAGMAEARRQGRVAAAEADAREKARAAAEGEREAAVAQKQRAERAEAAAKAERDRAEQQLKRALGAEARARAQYDRASLLLTAAHTGTEDLLLGMVLGHDPTSALGLPRSPHLLRLAGERLDRHYEAHPRSDPSGRIGEVFLRYNVGDYLGHWDPESTVHHVGRALAILERVPGRTAAHDDFAAECCYTLGEAYLALGRHREAIPYLERALGSRYYAAPDSSRAELRYRLGACYLRAGPAGRAEEHLRAALDSKRLFDTDVGAAKSALGEVLLDRRDYAAARPLLEDGYERERSAAGRLGPFERRPRLEAALDRLIRLARETGNDADRKAWEGEQAHLPPHVAPWPREVMP